MLGRHPVAGALAVSVVLAAAAVLAVIVLDHFVLVVPPAVGHWYSAYWDSVQQQFAQVRQAGP